MIRTFFSLILCISVLIQTFSQSEKIHVHYGEAGDRLSGLIQKESLERNLRVLASDEFEGRETGSKGIQKAANYISKELETYGIPPLPGRNDYYQSVAFTWIYWDDLNLSVNGESYKHLWDFLAFPLQNNHLENTSFDQVIFLGYGIDDEKYSDYQGVNVKDKVIMVYKGEPTNKKGVSWISRTDQASIWNNNLELKAEAAARHGARMILFIEDDFKKVLNENRARLLSPGVSLGKQDDQEIPSCNQMQISTNLAKQIIGKNFKKLVSTRDKINEKGKPQHLTLPAKLQVSMTQNVTTLDGHNILAYIEGSDAQLKEELVIVTAHYDHLGMRGDDIYNGADDNGSGTAAVMELARTFQAASQVGLGAKRSVLFMWVTGEEKGLLGSKYYVDNPVFPLENTIANINIDMIGRMDKKHKDNPDYIYVIGSDKMSSELHDINEEANSRFTKLELDYTYNDEKDPNRFYYRSDHYNFVVKGIPAIFYFSGVHDDYHRTTDTVDKIHFEKMEKITRLAFHVTWELANRDQRIQIDRMP
jgi:hypothetical protein